MPSIGPFQSPLWDHLDQIKKLRMARKTWKAIAEQLPVRLTPRSVRNFFVRYRNAKLPAGFESLRKSEPAARDAKPVDRLEGAD
jgi:hypothetical protein